MGTRIREWRKAQLPPLKGYELAKMISISQGSLSDIENLKSNPSAITLSKLSEHTTIDVMWVITGEHHRLHKRPKVVCDNCSKIAHILSLVTEALESK